MTRPASHHAAAAILVPAVTLWLVLALMGRELIPGSIALVNRLFGVALVGTYAALCAALVVASNQRRVMLYRTLTVTAGLLASLAVLEVPAALKALHWAVVFRALGRGGEDYRTAFVLDRDLMLRRIPGLRWTGRHASDIEEAFHLPRSTTRAITFTYDADGYRNPVHRRRADVVLLGDSYVEGWYVSDEETVAVQLERLLGVPVANLGIAGYGTLQTLRVLQREAMLRQPRVVAWFFFEGNDLYDDAAFEEFLRQEMPDPEWTRPHPAGFTRFHGWKKRSFLLNAFWQLRRWSHPLVPNRPPYQGWLRLPDGSHAKVDFFNYAGIPWSGYEEERWRTARGALEKGLTTALAHGAHLVVLYVPIKFRVYQDFLTVAPDGPMKHWRAWAELPVLFQEFCASNRAVCLDLTEPFRRAAAQGVLAYPLVDSHWGPEGHAIAAAELARVIREQGWLAAATTPLAAPPVR